MKRVSVLIALLCAVIAPATASADPSVQQAELTTTAVDGLAIQGLGASMAVSGDTLVVNSLGRKPDPGPSHDAAYVFERPASGWSHATQVAELTLSDGAAAAVSAVATDGHTIVIGSTDHKVGDKLGQGAAYVFEKPASGWKNAHETAELTAKDGDGNDGLGQAVGVSGDIVVASAPTHSVGTHGEQGAAYVFEKPASGWKNETQTAELTASDGAARDFLQAVAIEGDTIVAGAAHHQVGDHTDQGAAYVYVKPPAAEWSDGTESAELTTPDGGTGDLLGSAVAISGDTVAIGAPFHQAGLTQEGAAYVFLKTFAGWVGQKAPTAELTPSDGATNDRFGVTVGVSGDEVVVGSLLHQVGTAEAQGAAYLFAKPGNTWKSITETQQLTAADGAAHDVLGDTVAISGKAVFASGPLHTVGDHSNQGSIYVFGPPPAITIDSPVDGASVVQGSAVAASYSCGGAPTCSGTVANGAAVDTSVLGPHTLTVDAVDADGLAGTRSATYTVVPARTVVDDPPPVALAISGVKQSRSKWRVRGKRRVGTTFSFRLNKPARVALSFRSRGKRAGSLQVSGKAGANSVRFKGRITRKRRLRAGGYSLQITATNAAGERVVSHTLKFKIVR